MAGIRITGMASGLPPNIVEQLMDAERIPVKQMEVGKAKQEDKLKLVQELESKVTDITKNFNDLAGAGGFLDKKFVSGDPNVVDGQIDAANAIPGDYSVEVMQLAQKPSAISNGFPDKDKTQMGVGYIKFETKDGTKEVYINGKNSTLGGVANQINKAGVGLTAQVVEDHKDEENPFKIVISGVGTGNGEQVTFPKVYMLDGDQDMYFENSRPAQNAKIKVDGFEIEIPENKSTDLIPGVTLDFKTAAPGKEIRMTVRENLEVISGKIKSFVDAYNAAFEFIQKQNKLSAGNGKNPALGPLGGDGMLRSVETALRRAILNQVTGVETPIKRMNELGVEFNRNGTLNFSQDKFNKVLNGNPAGVAAFFRGDGFNTGFISVVKREIGALTNGQFGVLSNRQRGLESRIKQVNSRIETKERQLERKEDSLRRKFADLEQKMSSMQTQQAKVAAMTGQNNNNNG